jgi:nucleoside 2-deoxyribosyltransferase
MNKSVYLAGPIAGLTYDGAQDWRNEAYDALRRRDIKAFSPLRGKEYLRVMGELDAQAYNSNPLSSARGIMCRDFHDCTTCDVLLVNLLGSKKVSIGSCMEMAWAYQKRTPVVCVIEDDGSNCHEHAMIGQAIDYRADTLEQGIALVVAILNPSGV